MAVVVRLRMGLGPIVTIAGECTRDRFPAPRVSTTTVGTLRGRRRDTPSKSYFGDFTKL